MAINNYRLLIVNDLELNFMVGGLAEIGNNKRLLIVDDLELSFIMHG